MANTDIQGELQRLTVNATKKREELLLPGLKKSKHRKHLTVISGVLALASAGTISAVTAKLFGQGMLEYIAALIAAISGISSLLIAVHYSDDEIVAMLSGAAKYLSLRENAARLAVHPDISEKEQYERLVELQEEYSRLDEIYSRYYSFDYTSRNGTMVTRPTTQLYKKLKLGKATQ